MIKGIKVLLGLFLFISVVGAKQKSLLEKDFLLKVDAHKLSYQLTIKGNYVEWKYNGAKLSFYQNQCHRPYLKRIERALLPNLVRWRSAKTEEKLDHYLLLTLNQYNYKLNPNHKFAIGYQQMPGIILDNIRMARTKCEY